MRVRDSDRLVWIDMEMSGLSPELDRVLEVAVVLTDGDLNIIAYGPDVVVHQPEHVLESMDEWCTNQHTSSGLVNEVRRSRLTVEEVDKRVLSFLRDYIPAGVVPLAGSSIYLDRSFLERYLPLTNEHLHYRQVDVSSVMELAKRWKPSVLSKAPKGTDTHRALDDILESIEKLRYYREVFFRK